MPSIEKDDKKIVFFGLGSIGKKHAKIIEEKYPLKIISYRTKKGQEINDLKIKKYKNLDNVFSQKPDIAFITNPTHLHIETALECAKHNIDLFIEKPLSHNKKNIDILEKEIKKRKLFTYVAYNMRFHPVISNIKKIISESKKPIYFKIICSSYLPTWRPNQEYTKSYSAKKELGGGVILDLSHEFDYISWFFGTIKKIDGICEKISNLKINSEDLLDAEITCENKIKGNLHLDYFSNKNERKIQVYFNDKYVEGNLIDNTIKTIDENGKEKIIKYKEGKEETYSKQLKYFFNEYKSRNLKIMNNYSEALKTFKKIISFREEYCKI